MVHTHPACYFKKPQLPGVVVVEEEGVAVVIAGM